MSFGWNLFVLVSIYSTIVQSGRVDWTIEESPSFWNEQARQSIDEIVRRKENFRRAKNVILFLGDGMGISTVTAGRIRKGQILGQLGEDFQTEMEQFPHTGFVKTYFTHLRFVSIEFRETESITHRFRYNIDRQTPDSAATATAYLCGVKARLGTIGVDGRAIRKSCSSSIGTHVSSILDWAQNAG